MSDVSCKLRDVVEVASLPRCVFVAFDEVPEVFDGEVDGQELTIKGTVPRLWWAEFLGEVSNGAPPTIAAAVLLQRHSLTHQS